MVRNPVRFVLEKLVWAVDQWMGVRDEKLELGETIDFQRYSPEEATRRKIRCCRLMTQLIVNRPIYDRVDGPLGRPLIDCIKRIARDLGMTQYGMENDPVLRLVMCQLRHVCEGMTRIVI